MISLKEKNDKFLNNNNQFKKRKFLKITFYFLINLKIKVKNRMDPKLNSFIIIMKGSNLLLLKLLETKFYNLLYKFQKNRIK